MEIKIVEQRPNPLLKRTEYRFEIGHAAQSTPSRESIRSELAKDLHVPKDRIVIERMHSKFGTPKTIGEAMVYTSPDDAKAIEREHVLVRNKLIEKESAAPPAGGEAAPAAAAEKPAPPKPTEKAEAPTEKPAPKAEAPEGKPTEKSDAKPAEKATAPAKPKEG